MTGQQTLISQKKRGPKPTGKGEPIMVRIQPELLDAIDAWISSQPEKLSRPEAIRRLVAKALKDST